MPSGYRNLREHMAALEAAGKLNRVSIPINKDTELHPLVRLQFRGLPEEQRKAWLFENVTDSNGRKHDMPVLICAMAGSTDIYAIGMRCQPEEIFDRWEQGLRNRVPPVVVTKAPCQEIVIEGEELKKLGLSRLPIPISTPGFDNAPYTSASHWISRDPHEEFYNIGNYRGMVKSETRLGALPGSVGQGMRRHLGMWRKARQERMPAAIAIGVPPPLSYAAVTRIPNEVSEYDVAGGLAGAPMEVVRARTVDLKVPAEAEIIIEGTVPTRELELEGSFGEFPGYMATRDYSYFLDVTCITMRRDPIYLAFLSQFPPSESSKIRQRGRSPAAKQFLLEAGFDNVLDVFYFECAGASAFASVRIKKRKPGEAMEILRALGGRFIGKFCVAVDEDVDNRDLEAVVWAIGFHEKPHESVEIIDIPYMALDPSLKDPGKARGLSDPASRSRSTGVLIDATRPFAFPPISLPRKEFMDRAVALWEQLQMPSLQLKAPWFGYTLGDWSTEEEGEAKLAVQGRYFETGEKFAKNRKTLDWDDEI